MAQTKEAPPTGQMLKVADVARRLNAGPATVYDLIATGQLKAITVGRARGTFRIRPEDLDEFMRKAEYVPGRVTAHASPARRANAKKAKAKRGTRR